MIKLFLPTDTIFTSQGEGVLQPLKCIEKKDTENWEVEIETPLSSALSQDSIIYLKTRYGFQPFRVNNIEVGKTSIKSLCKHIGYDTRNFVVELSTVVSGNCQSAMSAALAAAYPTCLFTVYSDITTTKSFSEIDVSLYDAMVDIASRYNGVLDFNGTQIRITSSVGADNNESIAYGKNLEGVTVNENWDSVVTDLKPIGNDGLLLSPAWLHSATTYDKPYTKIVQFDTDDLTDLAFVAQMYLARHDVPDINYIVKSSAIQNVIIGDTISVKARQFTILTDVIAYEYNVIMEKIISVEFGNYRTNARKQFGYLRAEIEQATLKKVQVKINEVNGTISLVATDLSTAQAAIEVNATAITSKVTAAYVDGRIAEINSAKPNRVSNLPASFEQGTLTAGVPAASALHIRTRAFYAIGSGYVTVQCNDLYEAMVVIYDSTYTYVSSQAWSSLLTFSLASSQFFKVVLRSKTGNTVVVGDISTSELKVANETTATMWNMYYGDLSLEAQKELYVFTILSRNGLTFDGTATKILDALVLLDNIDITPLMAPGQFMWTRVSLNPTLDAQFNALGMTGASLSVITYYQDRAASFKCIFAITEALYLLTLTGNRILTLSTSSTLMAITSAGSSAIRLTSEIALVKDNTSLLEEHTSLIEQTAIDITHKVSDTDYNGIAILSLVEQTASAYKVKAKNIELEGIITGNGNFKVLEDGSIEAVNGKFTGQITATSGSIGRFSITDQNIYYASDLYAKQYDNSDITRLRWLLAWAGTASDYEKYVYVLNDSGTLSTTDIVMMRRIIDGLDAPLNNKMIRSVITIGKATGEITVTAVSTQGYVGNSFTMQADKLAGKLANIESASIRSLTLDGLEVYSDNGTLKVR